MILQVLDIDYFLNNNRPVIRIFGKTENGKAVCCLYDRLVPYFYARPKDGSFDALTAQLNALGLRYQIEEKFLPFGYQEFPSAVMKIWVSNPQDVPRFKEILEKGNNIYEADILFKYRFMTDFNVNGLQWIDIDCSKSYTKASKSPTFQINRIAPCEKKENAKMRYLSVDIECLLLDPNRAPDAKKDPIIIISFAFEPEFKGKKTLVLVGKPCIASDMVHSFPDEKAMLETFVKIFDEFDPDIVTGYNINNFDIPYLLERLQKHNIAQTFGRCDKPVFSKTFAASQEAVIPGRVVVDPYQLLKRDVNVRFYRYDLNTVAYAMLGEKKGDVAYRDIPSLWSGGEVELKKLIDYGRKDAELSLRILLEKKLLDKFFELSKISGVLLQDCLGGQSIRIENMLLREFRKRNILLPLKPTRQALDKRMNEKLKGATVLEPKKGLYSNYVLVLDFQSLYPSIIKKYNISPDAIVLGGNVDKFHESPTGAKFVHEDIYEGVFPYVINTLLKERLDTKKKMKTTSGEEKRILDAKQHALKILANSFYGYCGYVRARLYMLEIASAITSYGRENIMNTKKAIEEEFPVDVIYGDTDSLFIDSKTTNIDTAYELGEKISRFISEKGNFLFEFEKVYKTFLILSKKRYAGWKFERTFDKETGQHTFSDSIDMKGIETVRRDWCLAGDTLIQLSDGSLKSIKEIPDKCNILTVDPETLKITKDKSIGKMTRTSKTLKITTDFVEVKATPDHRFFVFSNGAFQFKRVAELKTGDYIIQARSINIKGKPQKISFNCTNKARKNINIPQTTTPELCQIIGFVFGDGSVAKRKVTLYNQDLSLLEYYDDLFSKVFGVSGRLYNGNGCYNMVFFSKKLEMFFRHLGFNNRNRIPHIIHKVPNEQLAAFLRGYFDADGGLTINDKTASKNKSYLVVCFAAKNKRVAEETKLLLLRFGIWSSNLRYHKRLGEAYEFRLNCENARLFLENIGFTNKKYAFIKPRFPKGKHERLPLLEEAKLLIKKTGYSPTKFLRDYRQTCITKTTAQAILDFASSNTVDSDEDFLGYSGMFRKILSSDVAFTKIERIEDAGEDTVYDIDTIETDTFLANGLLSHNCPLVTETMDYTLKTVLKEGDLKKVIDNIREVVTKLNDNAIPLDKLTIVKGITKSIRSYDGLVPHIELAKKISSRNPSNTPQVGDRIGFVIVRGSDQLSKRAEDPEHIIKNGLQIDADYYINNQLLPPIERILYAVGIERSELIGGGRQVNIFDIFNGIKSRKNKLANEDSSGIVCRKCNKIYRRIPLKGVCECGGDFF